MNRDRSSYGFIHQELREIALDRPSDAAAWRAARDAKADTIARLAAGTTDDTDADTDALRNLEAIERHLIDHEVAERSELERYRRRAA